MTDRQKTFERIYASHAWRGKSRSGPGSDSERNRTYIEFLNRLLVDNRSRIRSVLDMGCGDWTLARQIDWGDIRYTGIDVVPQLVLENRQRFGSETIQFSVADAVEDDLPTADLVIMKDVLQHLSHQSVTKVLTRMADCAYALAVNDIGRRGAVDSLLKVFSRRFSKPNIDIQDGQVRLLKLLEPPFCWNAEVALRYFVRFQGMCFEKEVLIWQHPDAEPLRWQSPSESTSYSSKEDCDH